MTEKKQIMEMRSSEEQNYELSAGNSLLPSPASLRPLSPPPVFLPFSYLSIQPLSLSFALLPVTSAVPLARPSLRIWKFIMPRVRPPES